MTKRKMSENSLKNLKPISERTKKEQRKIQSAGGVKSGEVRREKIKRLEANDYLWDKFFTPESLEKLWTLLKPKEKLELLKSILPKDKQDINLTGGVDVQKIFITEKEHKETKKHIQDVINEQ